MECDFILLCLASELVNENDICAVIDFIIIHLFIYIFYLFIPRGYLHLMHVHVYMCKSVHMNMYVHVHVFMCKCVHVYMYMYIHIMSIHLSSKPVILTIPLFSPIVGHTATHAIVIACLITKVRIMVFVHSMCKYEV